MMARQAIIDTTKLLEEARRRRQAEDWDGCISMCCEGIQACSSSDLDAWVQLRLVLGSAVVNGERHEKVETAIGCLREAKNADPVFSKNPTLKGAIERTLGFLYQLRTSGRKSENLRLAIGHLEHALRSYTREGHAEDWALLKVNTGLARLDRVRALADELEAGVVPLDLDGEEGSAAAIREAVADFEDALGVYNFDDYPEEYGETLDLLERARSILQQR
jgi:hypothetical protein